MIYKNRVTLKRNIPDIRMFVTFNIILMHITNRQEFFFRQSFVATKNHDTQNNCYNIDIEQSTTIRIPKCIEQVLTSTSGQITLK